MFKKILSAFVFTCLISQVAVAGSKPVTITGKLSINPRGNATFFTMSDGTEFTFESESKVGKKVWKTCNHDLECTLVGAVVNNGMIDSIKSAKLVENTATITGKLDINPRGNATFFTMSDGTEYTFESESKVGKKVWKACERDKECTLTGAVVNNGMIDSIKSAKLAEK